MLYGSEKPAMLLLFIMLVIVRLLDMILKGYYSQLTYGLL